MSDINIEDMSDEDFDNMPEPDFEKMALDNKTEEDEEEIDDTPEEEIEEDSDEPEEEETLEDEDKGEDDKDPEEDPDEDKDDEPKEEDKETDPEPVKKEKEEIDYETEYKRLMAPMKANGATVTPKSVDDLIRMAQMGIGYHDKMVGIKPARKALKTLENNGLLDEGKLDLLIDISKGDPAAINKFLKDKGIDPLDINVKDEPDYIPGNNEVSDAELVLDSVLEDLESSPNGDKTLNLITKQWDAESKREAAVKPQIMKTINAHMDAGIFDTVQNEVRYRRSLGELEGVSDFNAYKQTGDLLNSRGVFDNVTDPVTPKKETVIIPKTDTTKEAKRVANKKAAKTTKSKGSTKGKTLTGADILGMSSEDFDKLDPTTIGINK